jgi:hypothetical protein
MKQTLMGSFGRVLVQEGGEVGGGSELKTGLTLNDDIHLSVSDGTADVVDVIYINMSLDLWGVLGWVKQQEENS